MTPSPSAQKHSVHFIGIGGIGMSGIARYLNAKGHCVSGSDSKSSDITKALVSEGIRVFIGHEPYNIGTADEVVVSSAIRADNPELVAAHQRHIKVSHRADVLSRVFNQAEGIAVAGTHGKTTTSGMVATILHRSDISASYIVGGISNELGDNARAGNGPHLVIEADESDGTLVKYRPLIAVLTNAELDHPDFYKSTGQLDKVYQCYLANIKPGGHAIVCGDDADVRRILAQSSLDDVNIITYGMEPSAGWYADNVQRHPGGLAYDCVVDGHFAGRITLSVYGLHNVANSLAALAASVSAGLSFGEAASAITQFTGMRRRFQMVQSEGPVRVVDDYAHHPSEVRATLDAARNTGAGRIISVFQPHRYSRTQTLAAEFGRAFENADEVILTDVYSAGEDPIPGVGSQLILESLQQASHPSARLVHGLDNVEAALAEMVRPEDMVITMGAGDIWKVAHSLGRRLATSA